MTISYFLAFFVTFLLGLLISPLIFAFSKKIKAGQTILHYVKEHAGKQGTPTMGGLIFIIPAFITSLLFARQDYLFLVVTVLTMFSYGLLGFLDDYIKVYYKQNLGLKPYQKIIGQLGISLIISLFVYNHVGSDIYLPFSNTTVNLGFFIIPAVIFVFIATVNSVNLIDGLDGLCGSVSVNFLIFFLLISLVLAKNFTNPYLTELNNLCISVCSLLGGIVAFLVFNIFPAKIFLGDTGSLAIGGFVACLCVLTKQMLLIPFLGLLYVITAVSDIVQVVYFKRTRKRVFKMAPLHHHFQMCGIHENKIVFSYFTVSFILNLICLALYIYM